MNDFDPKTGQFWRPTEDEIPEFLVDEGNWNAMNRELYKLVYTNMPQWLQTLTSEAFPIGFNKELVTVSQDDGVGLCFAVFNIIMALTTLRNTLIRVRKCVKREEKYANEAESGPRGYGR